MIGIKNIKMPTACWDCPIQQIAYDSDLFDEGEPYCCIESKSVDNFMDGEQRPKWCPLVEIEE